MTGVYPNSPQFDVINILARSLLKLKRVAHNSLQPRISDTTTFPKRIFYPLDFCPQYAPYQKFVDGFVVKVEHQLYVSRTEFKSATDETQPRQSRRRGGPPRTF